MQKAFLAEHAEDAESHQKLQVLIFNPGCFLSLLCELCASARNMLLIISFGMEDHEYESRTGKCKFGNRNAK